MAVNVHLDTGSALLPISEESLTKVHRASSARMMVVTSQGSAQVRTAFGEGEAVERRTIPLLTLLTLCSFRDLDGIRRFNYPEPGDSKGTSVGRLDGRPGADGY